MFRTTIMLPEDLRAKAYRQARRMGVSLGKLIRLSIEQMLKQAPPPSAGDTLYEDQAVYGGACPRDLSSNHDEHLYGEEA